MHAPTPTDEPLGLPALLLASFPLSPDRRHVAPGPLTDFLVDRAAEVYAELLTGLAPGTGLLDLVPGPVARGELDARLGQAIVTRLQRTAFLPAAEPGPRVRPPDAVLLDPALPGLADCVAPVLPGLITGPSRHPAYAVLGVRRLRLAELADTLAGLDREPAWWRRLYAALAAADPAELSRARRAAGAAGRRAPGARPARPAAARPRPGPTARPDRPGRASPGLDPARLAPLGLRVVHPAGRAPAAGPARRGRGHRRAACSPTRPSAPRSRRPTTRKTPGRSPTPC